MKSVPTECPKTRKRIIKNFITYLLRRACLTKDIVFTGFAWLLNRFSFAFTSNTGYKFWQLANLNEGFSSFVYCWRQLLGSWSTKTLKGMFMIFAVHVKHKALSLSNSNCSYQWFSSARWTIWQLALKCSWSVIWSISLCEIGEWEEVLTVDLTLIYDFI